MTIEADEITKALFMYKIELAKEIIEGYGIDLGDTNPSFDYKAYIEADNDNYENLNIIDCIKREANILPEVEVTTGGTIDMSGGTISSVGTITTGPIPSGNLSRDFSLDALCRSATAQQRGISNVPSQEIINNLQSLCDNVLQPIRDRYGFPIRVTSGYRCKALNAAVGGSTTSQHCFGQAADIQATKTSNRQLFDLIKGMMQRGEIKVGQLIWEHGNMNEPKWVHVSLPGKHYNQIKYIV